ncbi:unnamed protein product [Didymodactylos carnosus]|uniref:Uncharacterized protein n=1 Tax=Didymodactylos carnosus TaxID=1234261 RepID=A0A814VVT9_9BILA|nr:unnamed protein product [Didymodactylos carnosus]CAF3957690.1 unnamed protein product [Didymodactylos carnosus]
MLLIPLLWCQIFMYTSLFVCLIQLIQLLIGFYNRIKNWKNFIFNLYLFHHLFISLCRSLLTFFHVYFACSNKCLQFKFIIHYFFLISSFDIILFVVSESAHFWDSSVQMKSSLYNICCLTFGLFFIYFISTFFLSIHLTIGGKNPFITELCLLPPSSLLSSSSSSQQIYIEHSTEKVYETEIINRTSFIPILILFILFVLIDILTFSWIIILYKEIYKLKRKSLASIFFQTLVFTKFKEHERTNLVDISLKRIQSSILFVLSNMIVIIPILIIKLFQITLTTSVRLILIFLTSLPLCECFTFLFYDEFKLTTKLCLFTFQKLIIKKKNNNNNKNNTNILKSTYQNEYMYEEQIGIKLSSYRETEV